jgi:hypothetical protein
MTITRQTAQTLSAATVAALQALAEEHGMIVSLAGGTRYSDATVTIKIEFTATVEADGVGIPGAPVNFARDAAAIGLDDHAWGREFTVGGTVYRVTGIKLSRRKYPVSAVRVSDGRSFKFMASSVRDDVGCLSQAELAALVAELLPDTARWVGGMLTRSQLRARVMLWTDQRQRAEFTARFPAGV